MPIDRPCPECGQPLPNDAPDGICPLCSLLGALKEPATAPFATAPAVSAAAQPSTLKPQPSTHFGDYELLELLAQGGMGVVYKARQISLNRTVALKMIQAGVLATPAEVKRFHSEAEAIAHLHHPNIVAVHEIGEHAGQHYFSMDYVAGRTLADVVKDGPLPAVRAATYVKSIAEAVHYAHQQGIIHRDLKPANVIVDENDQPRITDFGLAKRFFRTTDHGPQTTDLTFSGQVLGSPNYLPPEQAEPKRGPVGPAGDVYALGAILYHLITGRPPFQAESLTTLLRQVIETDPVAPRSLNPNIPRDLETVCLKCLEKEPHRRYATAQALAEELGRFLHGEPILARPVSPTVKAWKWCRRRPVRAALTGALILVFLLGLAGVLWQSRRANVQRGLAQQAERISRDRLWVSYLSQARSSRWSNRAGRRYEGLEAVSNAALIRISLQLRNEAIACLALSDARLERKLPIDPNSRNLSLVFDPQFERYAMADDLGTIRIRRAADDREVFRLFAPARAEKAMLRFSPDGGFLWEALYSAQTNQFRIWDVSRRQLVLTGDFYARSMSFAPDGRRIVVAEPGAAIHYYDLTLGQETKTLSCPGLNHAQFDPSGRWLAISRGQSPAVLILDADSGETRRRLEAPGSIGYMAWSDDGRLLAGPSSDGRIYVWNAETCQREAVLERHTSVATAALFNHQGDLLVSIGWDGMNRFWEPALSRPSISIPGGWVLSGFSPDDRRLCVGIGEDDFGIWQIESARECRRLGEIGTIYSAAFSPDGRVLAAAGDDGIRVWDLEACRWVGHLPLPGSRSVIFHPNGAWLLASGRTGIRRWPIHLDKAGSGWALGPAETLSKSSCEGSSLNTDGRTLVATAYEQADAAAFDLDSTNPPRLLKGHPMAVHAAASPCGKWLATATWHGNGVNVWSAQTLHVIHELPVRGSALCAFSPDSQWLLTGSPTEYCFWKTASWTSGLTVPRDRAGDFNGSMAFSPDGRMAALLIGRNDDVRLMGLPHGQELASLDTGVPLCFSGDSTLLATAGNDRRSLFVWDLRLIRRHLASMRLDFDLPAFSPRASSGTGTGSEFEQNH